MTTRHDQQREKDLNRWAKDQLASMGVAVADDFKIKPASDDASFRRYFRAVVESGSFIFVDAPPDQEDSVPFVSIAKLINDCGVHAPRVFASHREQGFMMLSDLGDELYFDALKKADATGINELYESALFALSQMMRVDGSSLPIYSDRLLRQEMNLFLDWFLIQQMQLNITPDELTSINSLFDLLIDNALEQPQSFVHRDYHCRNLMVVTNNNPGVIDFQDAVVGPITYDLVSLLKDCYWKFPRHKVIEWAKRFWRTLELDVSFAEYLRWFDLMGLQRHLKCAGIFSRLNLRDGKPAYLADIPLVIDYIVEVSDEYEEFAVFAQWIRNRILPGLALRLGL